VEQAKLQYAPAVRLGEGCQHVSPSAKAFALDPACPLVRLPEQPEFPIAHVMAPL
jgi:hypothetical protein